MGIRISSYLDLKYINKFVLFTDALDIFHVNLNLWQIENTKYQIYKNWKEGKSIDCELIVRISEWRVTKSAGCY